MKKAVLMSGIAGVFMVSAASAEMATTAPLLAVDKSAVGCIVANNSGRVVVVKAKLYRAKAPGLASQLLKTKVMALLNTGGGRILQHFNPSAPKAFWCSFEAGNLNGVVGGIESFNKRMGSSSLTAVVAE